MPDCDRTLKQAMSLNAYISVRPGVEKIFRIIDDRWESQLRRPLYAAGCYLNPEFFYSNENISQCDEVTTGLYQALQRLISNTGEQGKIMDQFSLYQNAERLFGLNMVLGTEPFYLQLNGGDFMVLRFQTCNDLISKCLASLVVHLDVSL